MWVSVCVHVCGCLCVRGCSSDVFISLSWEYSPAAPIIPTQDMYTARDRKHSRRMSQTNLIRPTKATARPMHPMQDIP